MNIPYSELPSSRVVFTTRARVFQRPVTLGVIVPAADRRPAAFSRLDSATWTHADQSTAAPPLTFVLPDSRRGDLFLLIEEGDNQPLPIEKATVLLPSYALRLFRRPDLALRLVYGRDDIQAPRYDLQLLAPQLMGRRANDVVPGPEQQFSPDVRDDRRRPCSPTVFWAALALAVVVLLVLVVRLIRRDADALINNYQEPINNNERSSFCYSYLVVGYWFSRLMLLHEREHGPVEDLRLLPVRRMARLGHDHRFRVLDPR